jgi:hypothetical protein
VFDWARTFCAFDSAATGKLSSNTSIANDYLPTAFLLDHEIAAGGGTFYNSQAILELTNFGAVDPAIS